MKIITDIWDARDAIARKAKRFRNAYGNGGARVTIEFYSLRYFGTEKPIRPNVEYFEREIEETESRIRAFNNADLSHMDCGNQDAAYARAIANAEYVAECRSAISFLESEGVV